jgi:GT2 family glycosyltransferase
LPILAIVVLNWNNAEATIACANSVHAALDTCTDLDQRSQLIIVDNGSSASDLARLTHWCHEQASTGTSLLQNGGNLGFAKGMNRGVAHAQQLNPDFIWLLNNDTHVDGNAITAMLDYARSNPDVKVAGATVLDSESGRVQSAPGYRYYPALGYSSAMGAGELPENLENRAVAQADYVDGSAIWLDATFAQRTGGIPEKNFLYFEELELSRSLMRGERLGWCHDCLIYHQGSGSSSSRSLEARTSYYAALSAFRYTLDYTPWWLPTVIAARFAGITARAIRRGHPQLVCAIARATADFLLGRGK